MQHSGTALRAVCAQVAGAATSPPRPSGCRSLPTRSRWPTATFCAADGRRTSYWELALDLRRGRRRRAVAPRARRGYAVVGRSAQRLDIPDKVARPAAVHRTTCAWTACCTAGCCARRRGAPSLDRSTSTRRGRCPASCAVVRDGSLRRRRGRARGERAARAGRRCAPSASEGADVAPARGAAGRLPALRADRGDRARREPVARRQPAARTVRRAVQPAVPGARLDRALLRAGPLGRRPALRSGRTRRASTSCATAIARLAGAGAETTSSSSTSRAPAATATTPPTTPPTTRCCWRGRRARPAGARASGRARTSWPGGRSGPRWSSTSRPTLDDDGRVVQPGSTTCGATATPAAPARRATPPLLAATHVAAAVPSRRPPIRRWPTGGGSGRNAVPMYDSPNRWCAPIGCRRCRCAPRRCGRWAPT